MVSSVTRPIDVNADGKWALAYRQYVGNFLTHGQIDAATSTDGVNWEIEYNDGSIETTEVPNNES